MKTLQWQSMQNALCALLCLQLWLSALQGVPCLQATASCFSDLEKTIFNNYINNVSIMIPTTIFTSMIAMLTITTTNYHHCHHHHCHHENVKHHHQHHTVAAKMILIVRLIIIQDENIKSPKPKCKMPALLDPTVVGAGCNSDIIK